MGLRVSLAKYEGIIVQKSRHILLKCSIRTELRRWARIEKMPAHVNALPDLPGNKLTAYFNNLPIFEKGKGLLGSSDIIINMSNTY
ncbi:hypothetical protein A3860_22830 [Niastella vici]|uniref:Uncharacterized protein n=1 Tax=Niastella vici TaxID=1703345 RepID=A0A1V9FZI8_9BACT|nr:hypothetical protein A3860_22830 [Niastella vici]